MSDLALRRRAALEGQRPGPECQAAATVALTRLQRRHHLRRDLDLRHDAHDDPADQLMDALSDTLIEQLRHVPFTALFWPREEFERLLRRWPALADTDGETWDGHRALLEQGLLLWSESGRTGLGVVAGSAERKVDGALG